MEDSVYEYYANVQTEPVEWLWYPRKTEAKNKGLCATMLSPMFMDTIRR